MPDPIPASPPPAAPVVLPEPAPAPQLVAPAVDNWEPRHPSPAIADSDDSDNDLGGYTEVHAAQVGGDPRTFKQAMASPQAQHWQAAAADEILTLIANGTWELVELPPGEKGYKGRVVAKGCSQRPGIGYDDTYSPTFRAATLRTTLAAAGIEDMELRSVDISAAFTNGDLEGVIYMCQPEGFHEGGPNIVCRLKKSLYGLKQAARQWNKKLHSVLLSTFAVRSRQYIIDMLERYSMAECNPVGTPLAPGTKLSETMHPQTQEEIDYMRTVPYLSAVGSLNYLSTMMRPDISYAVGYLGRFSSNPGPRHWAAVKHLFRYLKGSMDCKLTYSGKDTSVIFDTYCDASHGDCLNSGRSTGGYLTVMGGGAIGTEAEYMVATEAAKEILWMRNILHEFGFPQHGASPLHIDNQSAISVSKNPEHFGRMKHLGLRFFWLRDVVKEGTIAPLHIPGTEQPADALTKALALPQIQLARQRMGLVVD
ncbi:hypothetical protein EST38_g11930 [Candolleomyces aberdarensis]|uniref:Reverse transcriptase Ty1/copia-type domain-containing protein n=1 Tax=Candolleomyces aberdarensis TaxID=2316362 RepID=A0A4Q2D5Y9_9AGAR|nr:hypothetical protein EST38_g11930 [Candolleomyces aberdarensis]